MPNRIIKESIGDSEKIASLTDFEFRLWVHLITLADDAGRGDARAAIIRGRAFPLKDRLTVREVDVALRALAAKGCVSLYTVDGRPYFWFPTWTEHQRVRECKPKYPAPEDGEVLTFCDNLLQVAASCGELPQAAALIQSESNTNPNPKSNTKARGRASVCDTHFDEFWAQYPKKVDKQDTEKVWAKLRPDDELFAAIMAGLARAKTSEQWQTEKYIPSPRRWLNGRKWEDELPTRKNTMTAVDQMLAEAAEAGERSVFLESFFSS